MAVVSRLLRIVAACAALVLGVGCPPVAGAPCRSSDDCIAGESCFDKQCRLACDVDADCQSGQQCVNRVCLLLGGSCSDSSECLATEDCIGGRCRLLCPSGTGCADGLVCQDGHCLPLVDAAVVEAGNDRSASDVEFDGGERDRIVPDASSDRSTPDVPTADRWQLDRWQSDTWQPDSGTVTDASQPDTWLPDGSVAEASRPDTWRPDTWQPDTWQPDTWQPDATQPVPDASQPDSYVPQQVTLMRDNFSSAGIDSRWDVYQDSCSIGAAGTVSHETAYADACGAVDGYAFREHAGDRCMIWGTPFNTMGYGDVHLKYSVRIDGNANIRVLVSRAGNWVEVAYHDTINAWTAFDLPIAQPFTNVRFDLISPVEGAFRRLDCVSITGWQ